MKRILSIALIVCPTLACDSGDKPPKESVAAGANPGELPGSSPRDIWILGIHGETETSGVGTSKADGACELVLPERGAFTAKAVLRLREYPRHVGACTILSSSGYEETPLLLHGNREGDRVHFRESTEARQVELTMDCDGLIVTAPTPIQASEHEFDMRLGDGETYEYLPPVERPGRRVIVRYTMKSRAFVDAKIKSRQRAKPPIEVCTPTAATRTAIQTAIKARDHKTAIDLGTKALGLDRLGKSFSIEYDPSIVDPDVFGGSDEDSGGKIRIRLGPSALQDAPVLLSTILHEAVGHGILGMSEHDPEYSNHWEAEELEALRIETMSAATLGLSEEQLARIGETIARRRTALKVRDPKLEAATGRDLDTTEYVRWISCKDG